MFHDKNGKTLNVGDQLICYRCGMATITHIGTSESLGEIMQLTDSKGEHLSITEDAFKEVYSDAQKVRSWKQLAQEALDVQNASNLSGVSNSFAMVVREVRARLEAEGNGGNSALHSHPIIRLWVDKMASLTGIQHSVSWASKAYQTVEELAK